jgi:hypothetical protein
MRYEDAAREWQKHKHRFEDKGLYLPQALTYIPDGWGTDFDMAMDAAQPPLSTAPNSGIPHWLTMLVDPTTIRILFSPLEAANIYGEQRKGTWIDETQMFTIVEHSGQVSSYGDYATSGSTGSNVNFPQKQSYLYQTIKQLGEREIERAGRARISWVGEIDAACAMTMNRFQNYTYFYGVRGLQNYGWLNDPSLSAPITATPKAYSAGATAWITTGNVIAATSNEIYADFQALFLKLVQQSRGLIKKSDKITVAMSPDSEVALTATNTFAVNVSDLLKKNFPNITIKTATQFLAKSSANPGGNAAGNMMQMFVDSVQGQDRGYCAFNEKMRTHPIIRDLSSYKQKVTGGTWGAIVRQPVCLAQMVGI